MREIEAVPVSSPRCIIGRVELNSLLTIFGTPALTVGGVWIFLHLRAGKYLDSYLGEKAKNLATREDFAGLLEHLKVQTREVEAIKSQLARETWSEQNLYQERRKAYFDLLRTLNTLSTTLHFSEKKSGDTVLADGDAFFNAADSVTVFGSPAMAVVAARNLQRVIEAKEFKEKAQVLLDFREEATAVIRAELAPGASEISELLPNG